MDVQWYFGCWPHCGKQPSRNLLYWKSSYCYQEIHKKCCLVAIKKRIRSQKKVIWLLNNKFHELSPSASHHSLLFDQGLPSNAQLQRHLADRNAIRWYFVSVRLYLAMLFILSIM